MAERESPLGRQLFLEWMAQDPQRRYPAMVATALQITPAAVSNWAGGKSVPDRIYRPALRVLTGIDEAAWETEKERDRERAALLGAAKAAEQLPDAPASTPALPDEPAKTGTGG